MIFKLNNLKYSIFKGKFFVNFHCNLIELIIKYIENIEFFKVIFKFNEVFSYPIKPNNINNYV